MERLRYAVAKYVPDLFRQEPRNVGVIVVDDAGRAVMRMVGQRPDGKLDLRSARDVREDGAAYAEWFAHWERTLKGHRGPVEALIEELVDDSGNAFPVWDGGDYIPDEDETLESVADGLYARLVKHAGMETEGVEMAAPRAAPRFVDDVRQTFAAAGILARGKENDNPDTHLIRVRAEVAGSLGVPYRPTFSQRNGHLAVMENVDFASANEEQVVRRALSTAYMLGDILQSNAFGGVEAIALVHYDLDQTDYAQRMGKAALQRIDGIRLVNWGNEWERDSFIKERQAAADFHT